VRIALETERPIDLYAAAAWTVLTALVVSMGLTGPLRVLLALPTVLLLPGYALVAALFPERFRLETVAGPDGDEEVRQGIDALERVALSLGLSIAVVPLLGLGLNFTPWGIRLAPILAALSLFIGAALVVAHRRRAATPAGERFVVALHVETPAWSSMPRLEQALTVALALSVVAAAGALAYVLSVPRPGERFTEFYILGPGGTAADYPSRLGPAENGTVIVGIVNHEGAAVAYDVLATLARYADSPDATVDPNATAPPAEVIHRYALALDDDERDERPFTFAVPQRGLWRVGFELGREGDVASYRSLHLWVRAS